MPAIFFNVFTASRLEFALQEASQTASDTKYNYQNAQNSYSETEVVKVLHGKNFRPENESMALILARNQNGNVESHDGLVGFARHSLQAAW